MNDPRDFDSPPLANPLDRRHGNRSAADWIGKRFDEQRDEMKVLTKMIGDSRMDVVVGFQQVDAHIEAVKADIAHLRGVLVSAFDGDATEHKEVHERIRQKEEIEREEAHDLLLRKRDLKYKAILAVLGLITFLAILGAMEWARNFAAGAAQGRSALELQKGEPAKPEDHERQYHQFNR